MVLNIVSSRSRYNFLKRESFGIARQQYDQFPQIDAKSGKPVSIAGKRRRLFQRFRNSFCTTTGHIRGRSDRRIQREISCLDHGRRKGLAIRRGLVASFVACAHRQLGGACLHRAAVTGRMVRLDRERRRRNVARQPVTDVVLSKRWNCDQIQRRSIWGHAPLSFVPRHNSLRLGVT